MTKRAVFHRWTAETSKVEAGERGPVASSLVVKSAPKMCSALEQAIVLYDDIKRIDLVNLLNKEETFDPEAVYFAFPFAVGPGASAPNVRFEIADADMAPGTEQLPGTTLDWQTVQHWVEFSGKDARVVWSPVEAPLVQFGDINTGKWQTKFDPANAWVFSYAMNNYWMTNFKASQEGKVEFRYSLTSAPPAVPAPARTGLRPRFVDPLRLGGPHAARRRLASGREQGAGQVRRRSRSSPSTGRTSSSRPFGSTRMGRRSPAFGRSPGNRPSSGSRGLSSRTADPGPAAPVRDAGDPAANERRGIRRERIPRATIRIRGRLGAALRENWKNRTIEKIQCRLSFLLVVPRISVYNGRSRREPWTRCR